MTSASASPVSASRPNLQTSYLGPSGQLSRLVTLRASASTRGARVVAVTFLLDGKPLGSDTTRPYSLDIDAGALRAGAHQVSVVAVDSLGRRTRSRSKTVTVVARRAASLVVSPRSGLRRVLSRLSRGNIAVRLLPGRYQLSDVWLGSNTRLVGSGASTVISAPSRSYDGVLIVDGRHVRISDLVLDGAGPGAGDGQGIAIRPRAADVRISRTVIENVRQTGVDAWSDYNDISVQDSVITGNKSAGAGILFEQGASSNSSVIRTRVSGFRSYGIEFAHLLHDSKTAARHALALDNVVTDVTDPTVNDGTSEGGIWSGGVEAALIGNVIRRTGWDGIETVGSSLRVSIVANTISATGTGIYLEHATNHSLVSGNDISRVTTGINVEWRYDGVGSSWNRFIRNTVSSAERGLFVEVGNDGNRVERNVFVNVSTPIVFQGSSNNTAGGNRACGNHDAVVTEGEARADGGALVSAKNNHLSNNLSRTCSTLVAGR
ncbi:MAG: right-handed parallel beta-helix repeat-containing protein [Gaiellaceae bacterium]